MTWYGIVLSTGNQVKLSMNTAKHDQTILQPPSPLSPLTHRIYGLYNTHKQLRLPYWWASVASKPINSSWVWQSHTACQFMAIFTSCNDCQICMFFLITNTLHFTQTCSNMKTSVISVTMPHSNAVTCACMWLSLHVPKLNMELRVTFNSLCLSPSLVPTSLPLALWSKLWPVYQACTFCPEII